VRKAGKVELAGWTARRLSNDADTAKWLHSSNPTQNIVYGLAEAAAWRTILVVEGPGDRWGVGKYGAGVLGKTVGQPKAMRIAKAAGNHPDQNIVVLLDPTQDRVSKLRKRRHHIEVACESLRQYAKCGVHGVYLPAGTDPGSLDQQYTLDYVERELGEQGVRISWERK